MSRNQETECTLSDILEEYPDPKYFLKPNNVRGRAIAKANKNNSGNFIRIPEPTKLGYATAEYGDGIDLSYMNSKSRKGRVRKGGLHITVPKPMEYTLTKDLKVRRLTPLESERSQGFPDNWTQFGADGKAISDYQRYHTVGNAVTIPVIKDIARQLFSNINLN